MKPIPQVQLEDDLFEAALASTKTFIAEHSDETFFGFAVELLAEEGYFHLGAGSVESFREVAEEYVRSGMSVEVVQREIRWNNQEWPYFDFNDQCPVWKTHWQDMRQRINQYQQYCYQLEGPVADERWEAFMRTFQQAGEAAFQRILDSGVLADMKKTDDFRAWVFEHHDVF